MIWMAQDVDDRRADVPAARFPIPQESRMSERQFDKASDRIDKMAQIDELLFAHWYRRHLGEEVNSEALFELHPELMPELKEQLVLLAGVGVEVEPTSKEDTLVYLESSTRALLIRCPHCHQPVKIAADAPFTDIVCSACGSNFSLVGDPSETRAARTIKKLGHFDLIDRLGLGSFGTVWKARDTKLDRTVAIKIPRQGKLGADEVETFLREARTAAQLNHPNIVSVHEVGQVDDTVFIVSDLVRGVPLSVWMSGQQPTFRESVELCVKIVDALQHAHEAGIVHRDLKPHNIMIDSQGLPHLMDFGLARRNLGEVSMTVEGLVLGTPAYMSPEQARGEAYRADARSDIYSVGVTMFELLTGEIPFRGNARMLLHQVVHEEPPSPRKLINSIPRDLETICLKCLEKDPASRYQTAQELCEELVRFLDNRPIMARPISAPQRAWRWYRRNSLVASLAVLLIAAVFAIAIGSSIAAVRLKQANQLAERRLYDTEIAKARLGRLSKIEGQRFESLRSIRYAASRLSALELGADEALALRNDAIACSFLADFQLEKQWSVRGLPRTAVAIDRAVERYAVYDAKQDEIAVRRLIDNLELLRIPCGTRAEDLRFFEINGRDSLVSVHIDGNAYTFHFWTLGDLSQTKKSLDAIPLIEGGFDICSDANRLAVLTRDGKFAIYDTLSIQKIGAAPVGFKAKGAVFDPTGEKLMIWGDRQLQIIDLNSASRVVLKNGDSQLSPTTASWSRDGRLVSAGTKNHETLVWRIDKPHSPTTVLDGHQAPLRRVTFLQNDRILATSSSDGTTRLWNVSTSEQLVSCAGDCWRFNTESGKAAGLVGDYVGAWKFETGRERRTLGNRLRQYEATHFDVSPDGRWMVSSSYNGTLVWDLRKLIDFDFIESGRTYSAIFAEQGKSVLTLPANPGDNAAVSPKLKRWTVQPATQDATFVAASQSLGDATQISSNLAGDKIAIFKFGTVRILDLKQPGNIYPSIKTGIDKAVPEILELSPDTRWVATEIVGEYGVNIWDVTAGDVGKRMVPFDSFPANAKFSPDGRWLVVGTTSAYRFFKTPSWEESHQFEWQARAAAPYRMSFSPDSKVLAISHSTSEIKLVDVATGQEVGTLPASCPYSHLCFSADGSKLFCSGAEMTIEVWDLQRIGQELSLLGLATDFWSFD